MEVFGQQRKSTGLHSQDLAELLAWARDAKLPFSTCPPCWRASALCRCMKGGLAVAAQDCSTSKWHSARGKHHSSAAVRKQLRFFVHTMPTWMREAASWVMGVLLEPPVSPP